MTGDNVVPYSDQTDPSWGPTVESWGWKHIDTGKWRIAGNCPRCGHYMHVEAESIFVDEMFSRTEAGEAGTRSQMVKVGCNCGIAHPPGESGEGCGSCACIPFAPTGS